MNLTLEYPRSPIETMAGLVHVPRMLDKARAAQTGTLGEYIFPCPLDNIILEFLAIDAETFQNKACGLTDRELPAWLESLCENRSREEIDTVNRGILESRPDNQEKQKTFETLRGQMDPSRTDIVTWVGLIDLEEGRL